MTTLTDEQLMEPLQQGQTAALDELYRRYAKKLYAFCDHLTRSHSTLDPEDLVQDVFVRVIKGAQGFDPYKASLRTWLFRIARNRCFDVNRRSKILRFVPVGKPAQEHDAEGSPVPEDEIAYGDPGVEKLVVRSALMQAIRDCIAELDSRDERQAILLYYLSGKVLREIGEVLGKSTSTAKNRVQSAQVKVKRCLKRKGFDTASDD